MAFQPGFRAFIQLANAAAALQNLSTYADDFGFPQSTETLETTVFGSSVKRFISGLNGGDTVSMSGPLDAVLHSHFGSIKAAQDAGTLGFAIVYGPAGSVATQPKITGTVYVASYAVDTGVGGRVEYSASLQVDGAVVNSTW